MAITNQELDELTFQEIHDLERNLEGFFCEGYRQRTGCTWPQVDAKWKELRIGLGLDKACLSGSHTPQKR